MSRKPRKCRICRKRPVWRGGDVKDPGPFCKKCYHSKVSPGRKAARKLAYEDERDGFMDGLWFYGQAVDQDYYTWADHDVMLEVFFAGEVFEDSPHDRLGVNSEVTAPGWVTGTMKERPVWLNEVVESPAPCAFEPTPDESPPEWLETADDGPPPSWCEEQLTETPFVWPMPLPMSAVGVRRDQLAKLIGQPATPENLAHAWATGKLRR